MFSMHTSGFKCLVYLVGLALTCQTMTVTIVTTVEDAICQC